MRDLDSPDQCDMVRSDVIVPDVISLVAVVVLVLCSLVNPDISLLEKFGQ
jgi:hypothetical protein